MNRKKESFSLSYLSSLSMHRETLIKTFRHLSPYYQRYRSSIRTGFLFLLGTNLFALAAPYFLKYAIDSLKEGADSRSLTLYATLIVTLTTVQGICRFNMRQRLIGVSRRIEYDLRNKLFHHLQKLSLAFYSEIPTGDIMSRCTEDLNAVRMLLGPGAMHFCNTLFTFISTASVMIFLSPRLTLLALIPLPLVSMIVRIFSKKLHRYFQDSHRHIGKMSDMIQETFSGIRVVRAYGREENEIEKFEALNRENVVKNMRAAKVWGFFLPLMILTSGLGTTIVLWRGGYEVINGMMTLGDFVAFNAYLAMLTFPMMALGWVITLYQKGSVAIKRINLILDRKPQIIDDYQYTTDQAIGGSLEFKNLTFSYGDGPPVLKDINLSVPEGTTLGIVGYIGSGKSTLLNLIPRLYEAQDNQVFVGGQNIRNIPLKNLRSKIGFVPQEPILYSENLKNNIAYGRIEADQDSVVEAARLAELLPEIEAMPDRFNTLIGEKGLTLSRGQRHRATFARALLTNPKILILDDIFSSIDSYTERKIMANLKHYLDGRTCLIASHRISIIQQADHIILLKDGKIQEEGTHWELLASQRIYADMYRRQSLLEELSHRSDQTPNVSGRNR
jgi:ATP-binding cassette subfamily B protein